VDGTKWEQSTDQAPWAARYGHALQALAGPAREDQPGVLVLIGGATYTGAGDIFLNDVWTSMDGSHWVLQTANASWSPRAGHAATAINRNGVTQLLIAGGQDMTGLFNDVWASTDGKVWVQMTPSAPWAARSWHTLIAVQGHLLLLGGHVSDELDADVDEVLRRDVWSSVDGANWELASPGAAFAGRERLAASAWRGTMALVVGGRGEAGNLGDIWGTPGGPGTDQGGLPYLDSAGRRNPDLD
jgi:hypothetical protein